MIIPKKIKKTTSSQDFAKTAAIEEAKKAAEKLKSSQSPAQSQQSQSFKKNVIHKPRSKYTISQ